MLETECNLSQKINYIAANFLVVVDVRLEKKAVFSMNQPFKLIILANV